jgi:hypothetical protein
MADTGGHAVEGVVLQPLACWHYGFESRRERGCLSLVSVVLRGMGRGLCDGPITRPDESYRVCGVSECDREASTRRPRSTRAVELFGGGG